MAEKAFKLRDHKKVESSLKEVAEMSAHAFDKSIMLVVALI
jgi:hypothetical protein